MTWFEGIILGLLQGLTEFLPVSSSGHLAIAKALLGIETTDLSFEIAVHAATVLSVIVVFWKDIVKLLQGLFKFKMNSETRYILLLIISMIPVFIVGVFFKDKVEALFGNGLTVVGCALIVTAILLAVSQFYKPKRQEINWWRALVIGCAQAVAVIPGLSRSGATIATGLITGAKREEITRFSFLMVLVPILGEAFLDLVGGGFAASSVGALPLILGFLAAFASGLFACKAMIALVKKASLGWFAIYCAIVGILCIVLA